MSKWKDQFYYFLPGYAQGMVKVIMSYPFDTVKVYMQKEIYPTTWDAFRGLWQRDPHIFYRGAILPITIIPIERAITLCYAEKIHTSGIWGTTKIGGFAGGFLVGAVSALYYVPMQYITSNAVLVTRKQYQNIVRFSYRGFVPELARSSAASSIFFGTYMWMRDTGVLNVQYPSLVYGPVASIISWLCIFPLDTLRTERQTTKLTYAQIFWEKYQRLGIRAFYRGISPIIIRTIPSTALGMLAYEKIRQWTA